MTKETATQPRLVLGASRCPGSEVLGLSPGRAPAHPNAGFSLSWIFRQ